MRQWMVWLGCLMVFCFGGLVTAWAASVEEEAGPTLSWVHYVGRAVNFAGLAYLIYWFLFRLVRLPDVLQEQRRGLLRQMEDARVQKEAAEKRWQAIQAQLAALSEEIDRLRRQADADAEAEARRILAEADAEVARLKQLAEDEIRRATALARAEVQAHVATLATRLSEALLRAHLTPEDHRRVLLDSLEKLKDLSSSKT